MLLRKVEPQKINRHIFPVAQADTTQVSHLSTTEGGLSSMPATPHHLNPVETVMASTSRVIFLTSR